MKRLKILFLLALPWLLNSCNHYSEGKVETYYVVESYLVANRNLPEVKVSQTTPIDTSYLFEETALTNATVNIQHLNAYGEVVESYAYQLQSKGVYQPAKPEPVVPGHEYKLQVSFPNGDSIQAKTFVPGDFDMSVLSPTSLKYRDSQLIHLNLSQSFYPERQAYYVFTANVVDPSPERLTPFYATRIDITGDFLSNYYINSSGIKNEENYEKNADGTLDVKIPWSLIAFYGSNNIGINAIDDNLYDFIRTRKIQTGDQSILTPGQAQNIKYNVEGGIGIFGSMASDTVAVFIEE